MFSALQDTFLCRGVKKAGVWQPSLPLPLALDLRVDPRPFGQFDFLSARSGRPETTPTTLRLLWASRIVGDGDLVRALGVGDPVEPKQARPVAGELCGKEAESKKPRRPRPAG